MSVILRAPTKLNVVTTFFPFFLTLITRKIWDRLCKLVVWLIWKTIKLIVCRESSIMTGILALRAHLYLLHCMYIICSHKVPWPYMSQTPRFWKVGLMLKGLQCTNYNLYFWNLPWTHLIAELIKIISIVIRHCVITAHYISIISQRSSIKLTHRTINQQQWCLSVAIFWSHHVQPVLRAHREWYSPKSTVNPCSIRV